MNSMINEDTDELINAMVDDVIDSINHMTDKKLINIGLVGGRSVKMLYKKLSDKGDIDWQRCHFFIIDERDVPLNDKLSNYAEIEETLLKNLLEKGQISFKNIHHINTDYNQTKITISEYEKTLEEYGDQLDIAILSSGEDGHVAAIYPYHSYPEQKIAYIIDSPKPPPKRFTMTPEFLKKSKITYLLFLGKEKKEALRMFMEDRIPAPLEFLRRLNNLIIVSDQK